MPMNRGTPRREFLGALTAFSFFPLEQEKPDLILYNGNILTVNDRQPHAEAVAVRRDRFLAVGSNSDVLNLSSAASKKIDLGGKTVTPGFIDAHSHPAEAGLMHLRMVDCDLRSISAIQAALRERATKTPAGEWVLGFKFDDTKTDEGRPLTVADPDAAVPDHPVHIEHRGGHTTYSNSPAFRMAGIDEKTPDPPGGKIDRDPATGKLTGRVAESANDFFDNAIPRHFTRDDHREGVKLISKMLARTGITSATEAQGTPTDLLAYQGSVTRVHGGGMDSRRFADRDCGQRSGRESARARRKIASQGREDRDESALCLESSFVSGRARSSHGRSGRTGRAERCRHLRQEAQALKDRAGRQCHRAHPQRPRLY